MLGDTFTSDHPVGSKAIFTENAGQNHWVGTWITSPQAVAKDGDFYDGFHNRTLRLIIYPHITGKVIRLRLSNLFGTKSITFGSTYVAQSSEGASVVPGTQHMVTFEGSSTVTIPEGTEVVSDPVSLVMQKGNGLTVSLYVLGESGSVTWHPDSLQTSYITTSGDHTMDSEDRYFSRLTDAWFWLVGVDVLNPNEKGAIVILGASVANGTRSTLNANHRLTDYLIRRMEAVPVAKRMSILNAGIPGNRLLNDGHGQSAIKRIKKDVFNQPGVTDVVLFEGNNDINNGNYEATDIIGGYMRIIAESHKFGLRIFGATLQPSQISEHSRKEKIRQAVNDWIRTGGAFDGVIDFDKAVRNPNKPHLFLAEYDSGDHLHPNDAGYQAMADAVDLSLFYR